MCVITAGVATSFTAFSRTTLAPARTKAPGLPKWIVPTTGRVLGLGWFFKIYQ